MKILLLAPYPLEGASYRYRVHQYLPYLKKENIEYTISPFISKKFFKIIYQKGFLFQKIGYTCLGLLRRLKEIFMLHQYDVIFIHLESTPFPTLLIEKIAHLKNIPIVFDFDDPIFLKSTSSNIIRKLYNPQKKIIKLLKLSAYVLVANDYLKNFCTQYIPENKVTILPTCIHLERFWNEKPYRIPPVIGWIGSHSTFPYLESILNIFQTLSKKHNFILKIIGAPKNIQLSNVNILQKPWSLETEIEEFQSIDIGVYPLARTDWAYGKAGFKALQYMASGVPCIASNVGVTQKIIQHGINGFLVNNSPEEWLLALEKLLNSSTLRNTFKINAKNTIKKYYDINIHAPQYVQFLRNAHY